MVIFYLKTLTINKKLCQNVFGVPVNPSWNFKNIRQSLVIWEWNYTVSEKQRVTEGVDGGKENRGCVCLDCWTMGITSAKEMWP